MQACPGPKWSCSRRMTSAFRSCRKCQTTAPCKRRRTLRYASTTPTVFNSIAALPPIYQNLHTALKDLAQAAPLHVNPSRIRLALQGLEAEHPITRIAILGINAQDNARKVIRLLLADPLEDKQPWESSLLSYEASHGFLIRYGQPQNASLPTRSTLPILYIPSPILEKLNIEFLIGNVAEDHASRRDIPAETFLVPAVGVPTGFDGRQVTVNQPVHRALVLGHGFDELLAAIQLVAGTRFVSSSDRDSVTIASDLPGQQFASGSNIKILDMEKAQDGLSAIRESVSKATVYEHKWLSSGMPQLNEWLQQTAVHVEKQAIPAVQVTRLIQSIVETTQASLDEEDLRLSAHVQPRKMNDTIYYRTESAIDDFSRAAHQELQAGLASAWSSRNWTKLSWYKLFWRVDDVGLIISDLVTNTWLPKTERAAYEISGRLSQLGIDPVLPPSGTTVVRSDSPFDTAATGSVMERLPAVLEVASTDPANQVHMVAHEPVLETSPTTQQVAVNLRNPTMSQPIASAFSTARHTFLAQQITALTTTAQQLVFRTLSISGLSGGLSALTYVSQIAPSIYEASSIFAVGTVFALYRMQSSWQTATKGLESGLFEEGREVVRQVVARMKQLLDLQRATKEPDSTELKAYHRGREAVQSVDRILGGVTSQQKDEIKQRPSQSP